MFSSVPAKIKKVLAALLLRRLTIECDRIPYTYTGLSYKKIFNWLRVEASLYAKPLKPWGWPTHFQIEPTNLCNLRCALCPVSGEMARPSGYLDVSLFKRLVDEAGPYCFLMLFWDWGEPFMHPGIFEMISYAKGRGIKVASSTNGHLFTSSDMAERVVLSGLDTLIFAVDGISQSTYETYRKNGDLETVLRGIKTVVERKKVLGSSVPLINFRFIVMKHNEHEVPYLKEFVEGLGVDVLTIKTLNPCADNTYGEKTGSVSGKESDLLPSYTGYRRFRYGADGKTPVRLDTNPCKNLWNAPTIHCNGSVCPCTYDYNEKFVFGALSSMSFRQIWSSKEYQEMRRGFRAGSPDNYFCRECSYAFEGGNCIDETIASAHYFKNG